MRINLLHDTIDEMHEKVSNNNTRKRRKAQRFHDSKTHVMLYKFHMGDHVMVRPAGARKSKLSSGWTEPMLITEAKPDLVFVVENWRRLEKRDTRAAVTALP